MIAEALRESEARYRRVFEQCNDSILIIDPANDQIVEANPQASTMLGFSPEELLATPISEIHPHDLADLFAFTETVFRRGTGRAKQLHCRTKTGDLLPVELSASVIEFDTRPHILVLVRDLSESKRAEEALRESKNQLRLITESVPTLIAYVDRDQRFQSTNGAYASVLGTSPNELLGKPVRKILGAAKYSNIRTYIEAALSGQVVRYDMALPPSGGGGERQVSVSYVPDVHSDGTIAGFYALMVDMTDRKRTEQLLRDRTLQQTAVAELGRYALAGVDLNALLSEAVRRVASTLGVEYCSVLELRPGGEELLLCAGIGWKEGYVGRARVGVDVNSQAHYTLSVDKPVLVDDLPEETRFRGPALLLEHGVVSEVSVVIPGDEAPFGVLGAHTSTRRQFTPEEASFLEAMAHILADAVEQKRADKKIRKMYLSLEHRVAERTAELEAANSELEAFTYSVSHDLKQPLRAIDGYARMLHENSVDRLDAQGRRQLDRIRTATAQMARLIEDLLAISRVGRAELQPGVIDTAELVKTVYEELKSEAAERRIELRVHSLPPIQGDRTLIRQVFVNLLSNAIKFTGTRDTAIIEAGCRAEGYEDIYYVKDNGAGFDMAYAGKLFGVFQRLHYADEFPGTGVGLAIVKRIVERHGGRVWAEGKVDEGATFYFALPRQPSPVASSHT